MANSADPDQKPTDLDLHCLQRQVLSRFSRTFTCFCDFSLNEMGDEQFNPSIPHSLPTLPHPNQPLFYWPF